MEDYCQTLKFISDLLPNIDAPIPDQTLVMYLLNGPNERFDNIINVIQHRDPFPSFPIARFMLEREDICLKKSTKSKPCATHADHASSSTALTVTSNSPTPATQPHHYQNFRGNRRTHENSFRGRNNNQQHPIYPGWASSTYCPSPYPNWQPQFGPLNNFPYPYPSRVILGSRPSSSSYHTANVIEHQFHPTTDFVEAFTTMMLLDPSVVNWFMDIGATIHLVSSPHMLHSVLNDNLIQLVIVGNGSTIPTTSSGNSFLKCISRPLHLNNILITPQIVKKSDIGSSLYN